MSNKLSKYYQTVPKIYNPQHNPVINAFIQAFAEADEELVTQIENTKQQMFVKTASGKDLLVLGSNVNVENPVVLSLQDETFRNLIPNLSYKAKQIRSIFYDTMDVFWGPLFSRANITSNNCEPFNISVGDVFTFKVDGVEYSLEALPNEIAVDGVATAIELTSILNRNPKVTASISNDGLNCVNIRTNTTGLNGSIEILPCTMVDISKLDFTIGKYELTQQKLRTVLYEINQKEIIIELPAMVSNLSRDNYSATYFHDTQTIIPNWTGHFFYDFSGEFSQYTVSNKKCLLQNNIVKDRVYTSITVDDASIFTESSGYLVFDWNLNNEEAPVFYRSIPNSSTILLDPSYSFKKDHIINANINLINARTAHIPNPNGSDYPIYFSDPVGARIIVQNFLEKLKACGVEITFIIQSPEIPYIINNPYQ